MRKIILRIVIITLVLATGFFFFTSLDRGFIQAQSSSSPGSPTDPLVSKSYVDGKINEVMKEINQLKNEINLLKTQNKVFLDELATIKKQISTLGGGGTTQQKGVVTAQTLNVRKGPGTNYERITVINLGTEVTILKKEGNWLFIKLKDGKEGWAHAGFIKILP